MKRKMSLVDRVSLVPGQLFSLLAFHSTCENVKMDPGAADVKRTTYCKMSLVDRVSLVPGQLFSLLGFWL